jgi:DNA-binding transcriptional LysR family regulator
VPAVDLRQLRAFVAIAEAGTVGRAAERLRVAQPALSRQLQQLERAVGGALFARLPRGVRLTPAGAAFLDEARAVLARAARAVDRARRAARGEVGRVRVGFVEPATYSGLVPRAVRDHHRAHPGVRVVLRPAVTTRILAGLARGRLDAGLVYDAAEWALAGAGRGPAVAAADALVVDALAPDPLVAALPRGHPLARHKLLDLAALADAPFLWFDRAYSPAFHDRVARAVAAAGARLRVSQHYDTHATGLSLVAAGAGLTFIAASARRYKPQDVVLRPVRDLGVVLTLCLVTRADDAATATSAFRAAVRRAAAGAD